MWLTLLFVIVFLSIFLVIYHHFLYPLILRFVTRRAVKRPRFIVQRAYQSHALDASLPEITIVIPAHNEEAVIADKIHNLSFLDYPAPKLQVWLFCDGCVDNTEKIARETFALEDCRYLSHRIITTTENRGKIAVLNQAIAEGDTPLIFLTDASALLSTDCLLIAASHFTEPNVGVVCASYQLLYPDSSGEQMYWTYQTELKYRENWLGAPMGAHGAGYLFRSDLVEPLPADAINDDFILPMTIVSKNYLARYEPDMLSLELEQSPPNMDWSRRQRIAAGNLQQLIRLRRLLHWRYGGISFAFFSGKALRVLMPFCLLLIFSGSLLLTFFYPWMAVICVPQFFMYGLVLWRHFHPSTPVPAWIDKITYIAKGHFAMLIGTLHYLLGRYKKHWKRIKE